MFSKQKRTGLENKNSFTAPGAAKPEMFRDSGAERAAANYDKIKRAACLRGAEAGYCSRLSPWHETPGQSLLKLLRKCYRRSAQGRPVRIPSLAMLS